MSTTEDLVASYVAVWNDADANARSARVAALWQEDAVHVLQSREVIGHAAISARIAAAYEDLVHAKEFTFALAGDAASSVQAHHDAVCFDVEMTPQRGGAVAWVGRMVLLLGSDGRIRRDYQFGRFVTA